ncbi:MAG: hypothetical protein IJO61_08455, partial [Oscillospiraceae bacterium]|nr:hypothetical protein [Oscillospiraceae bacterium]
MMKLKSKIYGIATLYWMLFIYGFSAENGGVSGGKSMKLAAFLERIFKNTIGRGVSYNTGDVV